MPDLLIASVALFGVSCLAVSSMGRLKHAREKRLPEQLVLRLFCFACVMVCNLEYCYYFPVVIRHLGGYGFAGAPNIDPRAIMALSASLQRGRSERSLRDDELSSDSLLQAQINEFHILHAVLIVSRILLCSYLRRWG